MYSLHVNSSYAVRTPEDEVTCDTYWNFYQKLKIWTCFPQNGRFRDETGGRETTSRNSSLLFKTGGLEHMHQYHLVIPQILQLFVKGCLLH